MKKSACGVLLSILVGQMGICPLPVIAQDLPAQTGNEGEIYRRDDVRSGARTGALAGAALGALSGNAAAGAVGGAVSGGVYMYDQSRQDDRTQMLADAIASNRQPAESQPPPEPPRQQRAPTPPNQRQVTVGDLGQSRLQNFVGDWELATWSLASDGTRLTGSGTAKGFSAGDNATRIVITDFNSQDFPETSGGGNVLISYQPGQGFFLESEFAFSDETLKFVGEYRADSGVYNFYLVGGSGGETMTGVIRSSVRVEVRSSGAALWVADTYSYVDGQEKQVQSYRFNRR